jgi:tetratricopeptide (TPR) repeat protein
LPGIFFPLVLVLFVGLLLGLDQKRQPQPEQLLLEGHAAFARGDYAGAARWYEQAETYSSDPAEVAYYLAGAKYHLAARLEGPSPELQEAELLYRCCLDPSNPRRPRALCGLGNCLLHKAGTRDAASLRTALACYDQCLQCAGDDKQLSSDARYNREKARVLLLQLQPPTNGSASDKPPQEDLNPPLPRPENRPPMQMPAGDPFSEGNLDPRATGAVKPENGSAESKTDEPPQPGKGNLEPIPDQVDVPPLSPHDAAQHLAQAAQKVLQERQLHHRRTERPATRGVKDW